MADPHYIKGILIKDGVPDNPPAGHAALYADGGAIKSKDSTGAVSTMGGGGGSALNDLSDVTITTPSLWDVLRYDTVGGWSNGGIPLNALSDVDSIPANDGYVLTYDSLTSQWRPESLPGGGGGGPSWVNPTTDYDSLYSMNYDSMRGNLGWGATMDTVGSGSVGIGPWTSIAGSWSSIAIGDGSYVAAGVFYSLAFGYGAATESNNCINIGGTYIGPFKDDVVVIGVGANVTGPNATIIGAGANGAGTSIGRKAFAYSYQVQILSGDGTTVGAWAAGHVLDSGYIWCFPGAQTDTALSDSGAYMQPATGLLDGQLPRGAWTCNLNAAGTALRFSVNVGGTIKTGTVAVS